MLISAVQQSDSVIEKQRYYFANKGPSSQGYGFSSGHVWMSELDYEESWETINGCFWTVVLEKTLESPLDCQEIQPVHPKGDQSWVFIGRTDAEAETPILWSWNSNSSHGHLMQRVDLLEKTLMLGGLQGTYQGICGPHWWDLCLELTLICLFAC